MKLHYKILIAVLAIIFIGCSNEKSDVKTMEFKGNIKSVTTTNYDAIDKNGVIEKIDETNNGISILHFNKENNLSESIIYNSDKSTIKELKKYKYNGQGKIESIEETNDSKYIDNYQLSKITYPNKNAKIEKWYNSKGENIYVWNTTLDDNSNEIVSNSYENGTLNWSFKYESDSQNRLIKWIGFQKDSSNFNKNIITYKGLKKTVEFYQINDELLYTEVEESYEYGDVVKHTHFNKLNEVKTEPTTYLYEYDKHKNWIIKKTTQYTSKYDEEKDSFIKKSLSTIIEREIEYYD